VSNRAKKDLLNDLVKQGFAMITHKSQAKDDEEEQQQSAQEEEELVVSQGDLSK
jgi:hypothetical protein